MSTPIEPFALSPKDAAAYGGLSLTTIKALLRCGALPYRKAGRRTLILRSDIERHLLSLGTGRSNLPRNEVGKFVRRDPWKADDAKWFKENPERSHRLRPMFPGEFDPPDEAPPDHKFQVLVRQAEPGTHLRLLFCPNVNTPVPNGEALIHAIFDVVSAKGRVPGNPISTEEVTELAEWYAGAVRS